MHFEIRHPMSKKTVIKIKNSVVVLGANPVDEIKNFDLSTATPMDCFEFVKKLKERYGN